MALDRSIWKCKGASTGKGEAREVGISLGLRQPNVEPGPPQGPMTAGHGGPSSLYEIEMNTPRASLIATTVYLSCERVHGDSAIKEGRVSSLLVQIP